MASRTARRRDGVSSAGDCSAKGRLRLESSSFSCSVRRVSIRHTSDASCHSLTPSRVFLLHIPPTHPMARRLQVTESDDDDTAPESKGKHAVKQEKRRTRAKIRVQNEEEEEEEQPPPPGVEQDDEQISRGSKRRRINGDGNSVPSRAVSQEAEGEDEEIVGSQAPKVEVKTQPRDTDGSLNPLFTSP